MIYNPVKPISLQIAEKLGMRMPLVCLCWFIKQRKALDVDETKAKYNSCTKASSQISAEDVSLLENKAIRVD